MDEQGAAGNSTINSTNKSTTTTIMSDRVMVQPSLRITRQPHECVRLVESCQLDQLATLSNDGNNEQQPAQQTGSSLNPSLFAEISCECELENMTLNATDLTNLDMYVVCSIQYADGVDNTSPSVFTLKCLDARTRVKSNLVLKSVAGRLGLTDSYVFEIDRTSMKSSISRLCVLKRTEFEMSEMSESAVLRDPNTLAHFADSKSNNDKANLDYIEDRVRALKESQSLLIGDAFRLKLQVIIHDKLKNKSDTFLTEPVFTDRISIRLRGMKREQESSSSSFNDYSVAAATTNSSSILDKSNLRILRSSRIYGGVNGGDEIILLTSYIDPNDIQVEFFQFKNDTELGWRSFATLNKTDVHGNCSLVIRTPQYKQPTVLDKKSAPLQSTQNNIKSTTTTPATTNKPSSRIKVYYRLYRPSTGEHSDKWVYFYCENSMYDEFRLLFGDRVVNESRLITKMFAESRISPPPAVSSETSSSSSPFGGANKNKRKMEVDEPMASSCLHNNNEIRKVTPEGYSATDSMAEKSSKKLLKKWYKKEIVERSNKDTPKPATPTTSAPKSNESETSNGGADDEMADEQQARLIECIVNTPTSSVNTNDDDEVASTSSSGLGGAASPPPHSLQFSKRRPIDTRDGETQTSEDSEENKDKFRRDYTFAEYYQLKNSYESALSKMNALADRTSKALLKFARTRSLREFFKTQRFLLSSQDEDGNTPIHLSVLYGNLDMLAIFTDVAATISFQNIINIKNNNQLTALMIAAYLGEVEVCEFLLEANADLTVTDLYGCNVVHVACKNKNIDLLKVIIKYVNKNNCYSVLNTINHDGCAPIHLAVLSESNDILSELLYNGRHLKINIPDKKSGYTALHYAAMRAKLTPLVNLLVKNEDIDINAKSYIGCTPLHIAVANKNYMSTICLLRHGADLNIQSDVPVHSDWDLFQQTQRKSTLLRRCVDSVLGEKKSTSDSSSNDLKKSNELSSSASDDRVSNVNNSMAVDESSESKSSSSSSPSTSTSVLASLGGATADFIKTSQEVKRRYDAEVEMWCDDENVSSAVAEMAGSYPRTKIAFNQHNYDAFYYAQNDPWMLEIFKAKKTLPRSLLEKTLCFERAKEFCLENRSMNSLSNSNIKSWVKITKEALDQAEKKPSAQIKISQQATEPNDDSAAAPLIANAMFANADSILLDANHKQHLLSLLKGSSSPSSSSTNDISKP